MLPHATLSQRLTVRLVSHQMPNSSDVPCFLNVLILKCKFRRLVVKYRCMISTKEKVVTTLAELNDSQLQTVAEFLEFLKFRERRKPEPQFDDAAFEALYAEFADEDRELVVLG